MTDRDGKLTRLARFGRPALLAVVAAVLVWRIAANGLTAHHVEALIAGEGDAARKALSWGRTSPEALLRQGLGLKDSDPEAAATILARAYRENPADARPLLALAEIAHGRGESERSGALVTTAARLMPADPRVHDQAAAFWASRGDIEAAMEHWSLTMESAPGTRERLLPLFLRIADDRRTRPALDRFAHAPPSWWEPFFAEVAARASDVEAVRHLFAVRRESRRAPPSVRERKAYVERLTGDGLIVEAYLVWVNGLSRRERSQLGLLHDGDFELTPANWGFDWHILGSRDARVETAPTIGVSGAKALRLAFKRREKPFSGVSQRLFLDPGHYRLKGRVKTDSLETRGGLNWHVDCLLPEKARLGTSERFLGSNPWREFRLDFNVPDSCTLQEIRLVSAGNRSADNEITGTAWFDRMSIEKAVASETVHVSR